MNPGGENQTESDEEPEEKLKKHTVKSNEYTRNTEWVHRGEQGPTNFGIGWGQNHR